MQISKVFHIVIRFIPSLALSFEFVDQKIPKEKRKIESVDPVEHRRKVMKVPILPSYLYIFVCLFRIETLKEGTQKIHQESVFPH